MQDPKALIAKNLNQILLELSDQDLSLEVSIIEDSRFGDLTTNIALQSFKLIPTDRQGVYVRNIPVRAGSALEMAETIKSFYETVNDENIEKIEVAGPGFINFFLNQKYLMDNLQRVIQKDASYGTTSNKGGQKEMVEFTDPNPLKEFHIGHLYSNAVGESISRLIASQGATVYRACYQGDVGLHVAKAIYGIKLKLTELGKTFEELESEFQRVNNLDNATNFDTQALRAQFLGQSYAMGAFAYDENEEQKAQIIEINKKVYSKSDDEINAFYKIGKRWSMEYFEEIYSLLGTKFDKYYFESEVGDRGLEIVKSNMGSVFTEENGAVIFPEEKSGLHTRVFINSLGLPTYEAKELGLAPTKYEDFSYDKSIVITGNEINEYFKVLLKALSLIEPELASKTLHISHGMVRLPDGKMSSRSGNVITGMYLVNSAREKIRERMKMSEKNVHDDSTELIEAVDRIAVSAIKYAFLKVGVGNNLEFNLDDSISLEGNTGPYLQYTYVRTRSVLLKSKNINQSGDEVIKNTPTEELEPEEVELLRYISQYPYRVEFASNGYSPNLLCSYLFILSQKYNHFYEKCKVIGSENEAFRLELTRATGIIVRNGLYLLGISTVEKM